MAQVTGGDVLELSWSNPTVGAGFVYPIAEEAGMLDTGGFRSADDPKVDGAGRLIIELSRQPWSFEITASNDMINTQEYEQMVALSESTDETTWTIAVVNGAIYKGKGTVVGKPQLDASKSSFKLKVMGGGKLAQ